MCIKTHKSYLYTCSFIETKMASQQRKKQEQQQQLKDKSVKQKQWDKDGVRGGPSSLSVLVTWLSEESNYSRWKGGDSTRGETKETLCTEIRLKLIENNIHDRMNRDIRSRISELHKKYIAIEQWRAETGQGIEETMRRDGCSKDDIATNIAGEPNKF